MKLRKPRIIAVAAALALALVAQISQSAPGSPGVFAGTAQAADLEDIDWGQCATVFDLEPLFIVDPLGGTATAADLPGVVTVPVYFHVVNAGPLPEQGNVPDDSIRQQMDVLNDAYAGGQGGAASRYRFETIGVERLTNTTWHKLAMNSPEEREMKLALHVGDARTLNVYVVGTGNWGTFPWWYKDTPYWDGVVLNWLSLPGQMVALDQGAPVNPDRLNNKGDTLVHEVGHWLGLYHTFQGGCSKINGLDGDGVDDTPAHQQPTPAESGECVQTDTCPSAGLDPLHNFMNYHLDECRSEFTPGQVERMDDMYAKYRLKERR